MTNESMLDIDLGAPTKEPAGASHYTKTQAGHQEVHRKWLPLSRSARTLLLILDGSRPLSQWLTAVHGATEKDLQRLLAQGLVEALQVQAAAVEPSCESLMAVIDTMERPSLYDLLTKHARSQLGLIKGLRFVLDVERCQDLQEMRSLARQFIQTQVKEHGQGGARILHRALGLPTGDASARLHAINH